MKKLLLILLFLPIFSFGQDNTNVNTTNTKIEGSKHLLIDAANMKKEGEGLKYLGEGIYTFQQTAPNDAALYSTQEKKALKKVSDIAKAENFNHEVTNIERQKVPIGFGVARCLVTFKLLDKEGNIVVRKVDKEKDKDVAIKRLRELKQLLDEGIITKEEHEKATAPYKKKLLGL